MITRMVLTVLAAALALTLGGVLPGNTHVSHPVRAGETGWIVAPGGAR